MKSPPPAQTGRYDTTRSDADAVGPPTTKKRPSDTVAGCRERAAADLAAADGRDTENGRLRLQRSAASWSERARMLQERDDGAEALKARMRAEWDAEEEET